MTQALLEMRGISKSYGSVRANRGVDLTVMPAQIVGLLGENGSGLKARSDLNKSLAMIKQLPCQDGTASFPGSTDCRR